MAEKEYIVSLKRGVDYDAFNTEMIASTGAGDIPNRTVTVENARPLSQRNTHYMLTDEEAEALKNDSRVYGVELRPEDRDDVEIGYDAQQFGSWRKTSADSQYDLNWGMMRGIHRDDVWGPSVIETTLPFNYNLTGKGVDVVIQDTGIDVGHIEFTDSNGVSRVQQIDWFTESGVSGTQSANHYRDYDGHGSHVAGTVAGRTMGWAKDARIYALKVSGLEGSGDSGTGISVSNCFDVIKGWHNNKPIDPNTGYKRPTVVNMSWGYGYSTSSTPSGGFYRGASWSYGDSGYASDSQMWQSAGIVQKVNGKYRLNSRLSSVDTDVQEMLDAGIHICIASGNSYYYIDNANGQDYNNYVTFFGSDRYYHRGSSPFDEEAFIVGNMDLDYTGNLENKAGSSCCGPGVNIYAPGTQIMSASSNDNPSGTNDLAAFYGNRQNHLLDATQYIFKISGTSMASPNVAGLLATALEQNPQWTPAEAKKWVENNSTKNKLNNGTKDDWDDTDSIHLTGNSVNYSSGSVTTINDRPPFAKELNVRGIKLLGHGAYDVASQGISDTFMEKTARTIELMLDPESAGIDKSKQMIVIDAMADETLGDNTWGKGPVAQRIGYINGDQYTRSILNNPENYYPGYNETSYSYRAVDYVWEYPDNNSNGAGVENWNGYTVGGQVTEVIEHVLHTICQYGLPYAYPYELNILNGQIGSPLMTAMQEAIDNNVFDVSSYSGLYTPDSQPDLDELMDGMQAASSGTSHKYKEYLNEVVSGRKRGDINNDGDIDIDDVMGFLSFKNGNPNAYITDTIITPLTYNGYYAAIAREYSYLLIFAMWEYITVYISGGSLSPEWNDNSRTQAGVLANNPLGYALYNNFISKIISKPTQATLDAMFAVSGPSGYIPVQNTNRVLYTPFNQKDTLTVGNFTGAGTVSVGNK
tara:strand:+ start:2664 stop:5429 length:2766 start_codon:yes stop_codon:yes gene_type:complete